MSLPILATQPSLPACFAVCSRQPGNALVAAECRSLTGATPDADRIAACASIARVAQSAYIHSGLKRLAHAASLDELVARIALLNLKADGFRIEMLALSEARPFREAEAMTAIADAIPAYPNLKHPRIRFLLLVRQDGLHFSEISVENRLDFRRCQSKPYHTSGSMPARLARGMVNLVAPTVGSILDPCCGTGSILLQAQALGITAFGSDRSQAMVGMTRLNLAHFGYIADVNLLDARQARQRAAAIVTDLPYGRFLQMEEANLRGILDNCARLAPQAVFAAGTDLSDWLEQAGYTEIEVLPVPKGRIFNRFVHRARSMVFDANPELPSFRADNLS